MRKSMDVDGVDGHVYVGSSVFSIVGGVLGVVAPERKCCSRPKSITRIIKAN